jgi:small subunit ribosomal protein S18
MAKAKGSKSPPRAPRGKDANPRKYKKQTSPLLIEKVEYVDYKDVDLLSRFMSDRAKIRNMRVSGNNRQQQLDIANAIKIAREMALLPYAKRVASASRTRPPRDGDRRPRRDEGFEGQAEGVAISEVGEVDAVDEVGEVDGELEVEDIVETSEEV